MVNLFFELSVVLIVATIISIIMRIIKQPIIIGYILTGIIVGPLFLNIVELSDVITSLSKIGIAFLLFVVGLNLNISTMKEVGKTSVIIGLAQVIFTVAFGYFISILLGFSQMNALYLGVALAFSSTIIIIKLLSDKNELDSLYGKISIGFLLIQDLIVLLVLMFISASEQGGTVPNMIISILIKGALLVLGLIIITNYVMPTVLNYMARSQELLFLFSVGWVLVLALILESLGFRIEIGALFAGISFAGSPYHYEISSRIKPLRDFFIILFFVMLGSSMTISSFSSIIVPAILLSIFVLIGNPIIVLIILGMLGYNKRTSFSAALTTAQISEFSLILILLAQEVGQVGHEIVSLVTVVGLITIGGSTYLILYNNKIYPYLAKMLSIFERDNAKSDNVIVKKPKIVLFGYNRIGYSLVKSFKKLKKSFVIIDYDPDVIRDLGGKKIACKYGDAGDTELLDQIAFSRIEMAISTIPDVESNLLIIKKIRAKKQNAIIVITAHQIEDAFKLYSAGADYVILPHFLGGEYASSMIEKLGINVKKFVKVKANHIEELKQRRRHGHEHPSHV
tara:strand:+ start:12209 stop:13909 length:1701 start_codon:yes stop_codon:yes gene_type:complete